MDNARRAEIREQTLLALQPLEEALNRVGYSSQKLQEALKSGRRYVEAVPVLLAWLPRLPEVAKESVVRYLSVQWAKPKAAPILIEEFKATSNDGLRWTIGNALEIVADISVVDQMIGLAAERRFGSARQMVVVALGNFNDPKAENTALQLLNDEQVVGHAVIALRHMQSLKALPRLEEMKKHPKAWVRSEAKKAVAAILRSPRSSRIM